MEPWKGRLSGTFQQLSFKWQLKNIFNKDSVFLSTGDSKIKNM